MLSRWKLHMKLHQHTSRRQLVLRLTQLDHHIDAGTQRCWVWHAACSAHLMCTGRKPLTTGASPGKCDLVHVMLYAPKCTICVQPGRPA